MDGVIVSRIVGNAATGSGLGNVVQINSDTSANQSLTVGTSGTDFAIVDGGSGAHTFNLPSASGSARGVVTTGAQTIAGVKTFSSQPVMSTLTASTALIADSGKGIASSTCTSTELSYVHGVTSAIQTQLGLLAPLASPTFTGTIGTALSNSVVVVTDGSGNLATASTTATEIGYVHGLTSAIQTQLNLLAPKASPSFTGTIGTALTASRALVSDGSGNLAVSAITSTQLGNVLLGFVSGHLEAPTAKTYYIDFYAAFGYTITSLTIGTVSGTCTVAIKIGSTAVTSISAVSVSSTPTTATATGANTVSAGNVITMVVSSISSPVDMAWNLAYTRT